VQSILERMRFDSMIPTDYIDDQRVSSIGGGVDLVPLPDSTVNRTQRIYAFRATRERLRLISSLLSQAARRQQRYSCGSR
jgi:hypothetical protein